MTLNQYEERLGSDLLQAIERKGFTQLTSVQQAVLDPALEGRDLRITSQTGSGKTLAIGLALRGLVQQESPAEAGIARPRALIIAPTRELAHQVEQELRWLYAGLPVQLATTTGGASYRQELRALAKGPAFVVATPGRLVDHLNRGSIEPSAVGAVVLDEADRMLDLGFREDLETIFKSVPEARATHLVSATFPAQVRALADRVQRDPAHVQGTRLGEANADIDHVIHIVDPQQRYDALVNLLLAYEADQTLVFVRTRADASEIANALVVNGFAASALSGEMQQEARNRTLSAFRQGGLRVLIATDVAARGIDVQDITRVVHAELPTNRDAYTHRSGRTGRAGRKGTSSLLVAPAGAVHATRLLRSLGIQPRFEPVPSAEQIERAREDRLFSELTAEGETDARWRILAERLIATGGVQRVLERLLSQRYATSTAPRELRVMGAPPPRAERVKEKPRRAPREKEPKRENTPQSGWSEFHVSWGHQRGADPRRLLAMLCRRGNIRGRDVGAIRVDARRSVVSISNDVVQAFTVAAHKPDPREPGILIRPAGEAPQPERTAQPPSRKREHPARPRKPDHKGGGRLLGRKAHAR